MNPQIAELAFLLEKYFTEKSFKNFKTLTNCYCQNYNHNPIYILHKYIKTLKECDMALLMSLQKEIEDAEIDKVNAANSKEKYENQQIFARSFIDSLTDLKFFTDDGWYIKFSGIENDKGCISFC